MIPKLLTGFIRGFCIAALLAMHASPARAEESTRRHRVFVHPMLSYVIGGVNAEYEYNPPASLFAFGTTLSLGHTTRPRQSETNIFGFGLGAKIFFMHPNRGFHLNGDFEFLQGKTRLLPGYGLDRDVRLNEELYVFTALLGYRWEFPSHLLTDIGMGGSWLMVGEEKEVAGEFNGYQGILPMLNASIGYSF